jgi:hypothetical protein
MRLELARGQTLQLSEDETRGLYDALWERVRQRGAASAAIKLRTALTWPGETETTVAFDLNETAAVISVREGAD